MDDLNKFAMDDARQRQKALLDLILSTDRQAMSYLGFCITIAVAAGAGSASAFAPNAWVPVGAGFGLAVVAIGFFWAAINCVNVMAITPVGLPGRTPDFWEWAIKNKIEENAVVDHYLKELDKTYSDNRKHNRKMANLLQRARTISIAAAIAGALVAAFVEAHRRGPIF